MTRLIHSFRPHGFISKHITDCKAELTVILGPNKVNNYWLGKWGSTCRVCLHLFFWKIHVGNKSSTVWLETVTIAHRCSWKNNKRMNLWFFYPLHFSLLLSFFLVLFLLSFPFSPPPTIFFFFSSPFWISNKLVATKISEYSWILEYIKNLMLHFVFCP